MAPFLVVSVSSENVILATVANLAVEAETMSVHGEHLVEEHENTLLARHGVHLVGVEVPHCCSFTEFCHCGMIDRFKIVSNPGCRGSVCLIDMVAHRTRLRFGLAKTFSYPFIHRLQRC